MSLLVEILVVALALLGHGYLWIGIVNPLHALAGPRPLIDAATDLCVFLFVALPALIVWQWQSVDFALGSEYWSPGYGLGAYVLLCAGWGAAKLLVINPLNNRDRDPPQSLRSTRRAWPEVATGPRSQFFHGVYPRLLAMVPGNQVLTLAVDHKQLAISRLPADLVGLKIAHLSDLHMTGRIDRRWYEVVVEQVNALQADVVAITGDIVENPACWPWLADSVAKLQAGGGVYFVLGNHDCYIDLEKTRQLLTDAGLTYLGGRWTDADCRGTSVLLAGNERPWVGAPADLADAPTRCDDQRLLRLALLHTPDQFGWAVENDIDLALAGHTHGGQLRFPVLGAVACPSLHGTRYAHGVFRRGETLLHVTRGISGKTPLRWNCPPEIALLELVQA